MEKKKISFSELVNVLSQNEMKKVSGGSAGGWCYWESPTDSGCATDGVGADFMSCGRFWCCNCCDETAYNRCGGGKPDWC